MARNERKDGALELTVEDVGVRAADADGGGLDHDILRSRRGFGPLGEGETPGFLENYCTHQR
jgi:hypothetical protein